MDNSPLKKFNLIPEDNLRQIILVLAFSAIMLFIRIVPIYHLIFTAWPGDYGNFVNFAADDSVYHMRLLHNTIQHFPFRIFFDPFTHFPFGNQTHFGPLFTLIIAAVAIIAGLGHPTPELINLIAAYTPPVMGTLCLIPLYFIANKLWGKVAAIFTTFILTFSLGTFLQRSSLGFTDHHVAEVLFSTITCALLIFALNNQQNLKFSFKHLTSKDSYPTLIYGILAGIAFGLFILIWPAALMFGAIFLIFFITQLLIDHLKNRDTTYLLFLATTIYCVSTLMVLPYALMNPHLSLTSYSLTQPLILIVMAAIFIICYAIHRGCQYNRTTKDLYPLLLALTFIFIVFILYRYIPNLQTLMRDGLKLLFEPTPGMKTVSEVKPSLINPSTGKFSLLLIWRSYFWSLPLAIIGFGYLSYRAYRYSLATEVFLLTWTTAIILTALAQIRFNYYLVINIAILAGCYCLFPFFNELSSLNPQKKLHMVLQKVAIYISFCIFAFLIIDPAMSFIIVNRTIPSRTQISQEQYNTYMWLKKHTPDPQGKIIDKNFNYASGYYPPPLDPSLPYQYPKSAYGIMSWWDIGHQLTYIAERIPNTNPFQNGIIEKNHTFGAALFFTSNNEKAAVANLERAGAKYVLVDSRIHDMGTIGVWDNNTEGWTSPLEIKDDTSKDPVTFKMPIDSIKFSQSMLSRLLYNDANGLQHFRLIHESDGDYIVFLRRGILKPNVHADLIPVYLRDYDTALKLTAVANRVFWANKDKTVFAYSARLPTKRIKIFEKVKGAIISGEVTKETQDIDKVTLTLRLKTKFNRILTYSQTTGVNNGKYQFVVPYPTMAMHGVDYNYDITPIENYHLQIGSKTYEIFVFEDDVMSGNEIKVVNF